MTINTIAGELSRGPELAQRLLNAIPENREVGVAFSGGVDSCVVAKAAYLRCADRATAFTAVSPSLASGELETARTVAKLIGIQHVEVQTREFQNANYTANPANRCYFCKSELYSRLEEMAPSLGIELWMNGSNLDDLGDFRPGQKAAAEFSVHSPLIEAGFRKADVRELAEFWDLPTWDKPASPCLSSRIAYGVEVTPARVARIEAAEVFLRELLAVRELRVRLEANELARIEVPIEALCSLAEPAIREQVTRKFHDLGFRYVTLDLDGFRSGSLNSFVLLESPNS